ncbi:MAG: tetratricopeptide repeat protein, partial [Silicimonas sp.]|nr:tetratricopeptide repeat protein [Silicimonas sp.]
MRKVGFLSLVIGSALLLTACNDGNLSDQEVERALKDVNVIDETNLNDVMLTVADPDEAVAYFQKTSAQNPDRIDLRRGLAASLVRAKKPRLAATAWQQVLAMPGANNDDRVEYADALIRSNQWSEAESQLDKVPPTHETFKRYRLEAMIADANKDWDKADSFYEVAVGLTTKPSGTLNNWGYSKLTRGNYAEAERLFGEALDYDASMFTAKNNLVLARAAQRKYDMPVVPMTQIERAELLYTAALSAIKQGDVATGKSLLQ